MRAKQLIIVSLFMIVTLLIASCDAKRPVTVSVNKSMSIVTRKEIIAVYLFDLSGSTLDERREYIEAFKTSVANLSYGDSIFVAAISTNSLGFPMIIEKEIPKFVWNKPQKEEKKRSSLVGNSFTNMLESRKQNNSDASMESSKKRQERTFVKNHDLNQIRAEIINQVGARLNANEPMTDIFGSFELPQRIFSSEKAKNKRLVLYVFSDGVIETDSGDNSYDFTRDNLTAERINLIIQREKQIGRLPSLPGVKIFMIGVRAPRQDQYFAIKNFWMSYMQATGATLKPDDYGRSIPALILNEEP